MAIQKHIRTLMLLLSYAAAQDNGGPGVMQNITVEHDGPDLRVEMTLGSSVTPSVHSATHPDRILLDFPGITYVEKAKKLDVQSNGVTEIQAVQYASNPLITRVVVELDQPHIYKLKAEGNRVIFTVSVAAVAEKSHGGAPAAAAREVWPGIFRRQKESPAPIANNLSTPAWPVPPSNSAPDSNTPTTSSIANAESSRLAGPPSVSTENSSGQDSFSQNQVAASAIPQRDVNEVGQAFPSTNTAPTANSESGSVRGWTASSPRSAATETPTLITRADDPSLRTVFKVKYVAEGVAYLDGGRAQGLAEGTKLVIEDSNLPAKQGDSADVADPRVVAQLEVSAVAETSAVTDIHSAKRPVKVGDIAYLSEADTAALVQQRALSATRQYPAVVSFTEGDTLDEEVREEVPRPPLPSVNRARGRIGFDYIDTMTHGTTNITSSDVGVVFRGDITRIGGTYWNLSGYWRGRSTNTSAASQQTLQNLINRTYHLNLTYDNPNSDFVAGFGRRHCDLGPLA